MKILIIEDERKLSENIKKYLSDESYVCECAFTYQEAIEKISFYEYDCILLDLMLAGEDGLGVLEELKRQNKQESVIIISAKGSLEDKLKGLQIGADDYLPKPFHLSELSMRIYALLRRRKFESNNLIQAGIISIDLLSKTVTVDGKGIVLTRTEYDLLLFLIGNKNRVISKAALAEHLNGDMADMLDNHDFVYAHVKNLKSKLTEAGCPNYIKNVYGVGYKWEAV
ncbi:response regulator transcription factor [Parabacteroides sp. PF5-9]|uniref:response regulator transcription factor n=1 Tax=Parabacteroides sp. PF5-9 TaxID=1742404 RepID=UPI0024755E24|nr:response regulator transcription factor [Parabacteroides sp. PF5-9]MDH6356615.1 DNA-binding response OmpR family regulator [Parabacteroides sp. PF5-9]